MLDSGMPQKAFAILLIFSGIVSADIVNISPTSIDFGAKPLGTTTSQNVILANPTKKLLNIWGVSVTGDFASPTNTCGGSLLPGQQCLITITFRAGSLGVHTGILSVDDDANHSLSPYFYVAGGDSDRERLLLVDGQSARTRRPSSPDRVRSPNSS